MADSTFTSWTDTTYRHPRMMVTYSHSAVNTSGPNVRLLESGP